jgi:peptidyl-prolyl cis-trans isomerase B (cyclophilin B)
VASSKTRQRKMARAKMERQLARRAAKAGRRRQLQAGIAVGVAVLVLVFGGLYFGGVFSPNKPKATADDCLWTPSGTSAVAGIGTPPTSGIAKSGTDVLTIATDQGSITADIDRAKTPCTAASLSYLASKGFYKNTACTRLTTAGTFLLQCGDPTGDGTGGPGYTSVDENVPEATAPTASPSSTASASPSASASASPSATASASPSASSTPTAVYPRGSVVMQQTNGPNTNGSQFFIVYQDSRLPATLTVVGTVTAGMEVVDKVAAGGVAAGGASTTDGKPNTAITIQTLSVAPGGSATPSQTASPSPTASQSASPSATASPSGSTSS